MQTGLEREGPGEPVRPRRSGSAGREVREDVRAPPSCRRNALVATSEFRSKTAAVVLPRDGVVLLLRVERRGDVGELRHPQRAALRVRLRSHRWPRCVARAATSSLSPPHAAATMPRTATTAINLQHPFQRYPPSCFSLCDPSVEWYLARVVDVLPSATVPSVTWIRSGRGPRIERIAKTIADEVEGEGRQRTARDPGRSSARARIGTRHLRTASMAPHDGVESGTPTPRNDRPASNRMLRG